jgi:predicted secreted protein
MTGKLGQIKDSIRDARSGRLIFISHCLLNQNACVRGLASQPAVIRQLLDLLLEHQAGIFQMTCPEVSYLGSMRWGQVKKQYGNPMFRRHCRRIARDVCDQVQTYRDNDHGVVGIVLRDGSPTCGLRCAAVEADADQVWGGMVWNASPRQRFGNTPGVYSEELQAEILSRPGFAVPLFALPEVAEAGSFDKSLEEIEQALNGVD